MIRGRPRRGTRERSWGVDEGDGGIAVASGVVAGNRLIRRMLDRDDARERIHAEQGDEPRRLPARVWRVCKRHIVLPGVQVFREGQGVHAMDQRPVIHLEEGDVGLEGRQGEPVDLYEVRAHGPARERFETEGARAREQVEDARATQRALENGEPRLAHAVPGGPDRVPRGRLQTTTLELAGDDANHSHPRSPENAEFGVRNAECQAERRAASELQGQFRIPHSAFRILTRSAPWPPPAPAASSAPATRRAPGGRRRPAAPRANGRGSRRPTGTRSRGAPPTRRPG